MVNRLLVLCALAMAGSGAATVSAQTTAAEISVGVRPAQLRAGGTFTVTVRVIASEVPTAIEFAPGPTARLDDVVDRSSARVGSSGALEVFERDYQLTALVPGRVRLPPVLIEVGGRVYEEAIPEVLVAQPGLDWGTVGGSPRSARGAEPPLLPEGTPPRAEGRDYDASNPAPTGWPGTPLDPSWGSYGLPPGSPGATPGVPYGPGLGRYDGNPYVPGGYGGYGPGGYSAYGGYGRLPPGEGWAATATSDPWWPELIPELDLYDSLVEDPQGLALLQTGLTPKRVFVGQQVTLVATATFPPEAAYRMTRDPEFFPAGASDAWVVDVPWAAPAPAAVGGRLEQAHTFLRAYFPMNSGRLTIDPARLSYSAASGAARPPLDTLASQPLTVDVLPIPEVDAPDNWTGAVGRYRVSAWLSPARVGWGESALLMVEIAGAGHLPSQPRPDPGPVWGGGLRPMGERAWIEVRDGVVGGVKRFTWLVVPVEAGPVRIGPIFYSFFDPYVGAFGQASSEELTLVVEPYPSAATPGGAAGGASGRPAELGGVPDPELSGPYGLPSPLGTAAGTAEPRAPFEGVSTRVTRADTDDAVGRPGPAPGVGTTVARDPGAEAPRTMPIGPEARADALLAKAAEASADPRYWSDLGTALAEARPGEGWEQWAWRTGLRSAPRDAELQTLVWGSPAWRADPGLPLLPVRPGEAAFSTLLLGALAGLLGGAGGLLLFRGGPEREGRALLVAAVILATGSAFSGLAWSQSTASGSGVVVGGATPLRAGPLVTAESRWDLAAGEAVRVHERYGDWVRVEDDSGRGGWVEDRRVQPLGALALGSS